jgi:flagellar hook-basal body complex protein FliE
MSPISSIPPALPQIDAVGIRDLRPDLQMPLDRTQDVAQAQPGSFESMLGRMVSEVNGKQHVAADAVAALQSGQPIPLHQAVIAMEEANVSFQLMVEVRNKLLESYQELMRMQI